MCILFWGHCQTAFARSLSLSLSLSCEVALHASFRWKRGLTFCEHVIACVLLRVSPAGSRAWVRTFPQGNFRGIEGWAKRSVFGAPLWALRMPVMQVMVGDLSGGAAGWMDGWMDGWVDGQADRSTQTTIRPHPSVRPSVCPFFPPSIQLQGLTSSYFLRDCTQPHI